MATLTVYPDANPETSSVDGAVLFNEDADHTWVELHDDDGSDPFVSASDSGSTMGTSLSWWVNGYGSLSRSIIGFDTSDLPSDAEIVSATLSLYCTAKGYTVYLLWPDCSPAIGQSNPISATALSASDYDYTRFGSTQFALVDYFSINTGAYNDFDLNSSGMASIDKDGVSSFSCMTPMDLADDPPGDPGSTHVYVSYTWGTADYGASYKPKLAITYSTTGAGTGGRFMGNWIDGWIHGWIDRFIDGLSRFGR